MKKLIPQILVFMQFSLIGLIVLFSKGFFSSLLAITIFIIGTILGFWALSYNRLGNFNIQPKMKKNATLITTGIYQYVRHPMYLSVIITSFAFLSTTFSYIEWILFVFLIIVLFLKAKIEESIWSNHTEEYEEYKKRSKLILPFIL